MRTAFLAGLNGDGFFSWVGWGRLSYMSWMKTAFSNGLIETTFSAELNRNGFFSWVEWGRLF
jgi:hypothetical protein